MFNDSVPEAANSSNISVAVPLLELSPIQKKKLHLLIRQGDIDGCGSCFKQGMPLSLR
jgi:hypothetical protein